MTHSYQTPSGDPEFSLDPGTMVADYRVIERLGAGGMGEVYIAEDTQLKRRVALKFLPPSLVASADWKARFQQEARAAAALDHPNIITIYEVSEYQGRPFFAMQHVEGRTLDKYVADEKPSIDTIIDLAIRIGEGLEHAHEAGIVHRDIKPANIVIDMHGSPKILDFGVATAPGDEHTSVDGSTAGTPAFMSPEQVQGEKVDQRSDLFSFGVLLYWILTGKQPFTGEYEASIIYAIVNETPERISNLRPEVPPRLEEIVGKLLEKSPADRYHGTTEVLADLQALQEERAGGGRAAHKWRPTGWWALAAAALVMIAVGLMWVGQIYDGTDMGVAPGRKVLAVMPFENLGPPEDEYFADGMTDEITGWLVRFGDLDVIARSSSMQYKHTKKSTGEIGAELGVSYILTGTVQWDKASANNKVSISAKLIRVADGSYLWVDSYERVYDRVTKVFALQSEIAGNVTRRLNLAVGAGQEQPRADLTDNLEAYDSYLRGNQYFNRSWKREDIEIAISMYERAIGLDSLFAAAHAMLSRGLGSMYSENYDRSPRRLSRAKRAALRALELAPELPEGHLALGYYHYCDLDYANALAEFNLVQEREPNNQYVYGAIGGVYRRQGNLDLSVEYFQKASQLDPLSYLRAFDVALSYGMMRRYAEAEHCLDRTQMLAPEWDLPYTYRAWLYILRDGDITQARAILGGAAHKADLARSQYYWWLARIVESDYQKVLAETAPGPDTVTYYLHCAQMHRLLGQRKNECAYADSARQLLENVMEEQSEQARFCSHLSLAYTGLRQKEQALAYGKKAVELLPTSRETFDAMFLLVNLTETLVVFGEYDAAVEQLGHLLSIPGFASIPYLQLDPLWRPLHNHPGFKALLVNDEES